jgi:hypothetical protein
VFAERLRRLAARAPRRAPGPLAWLSLCALTIAAAAAVRLTGVDPLWLGVLQFAPTVVLLVAFAAAADVALSDVSPGANDPASGVAVALALHAALSADPPAGLSPALVLTGAGENLPPAAIRAHLRAERLSAQQVVLLEIGACGAGAPVVFARHPQLRAAAVGAGLPLAPLRRPTAVRAARSLRLPAARLACLDPSGITPRSRQPTDTPDRVDVVALRTAMDGARALVEALDAQLARPPASALAQPAGDGEPEARARASSAK